MRLRLRLTDRWQPARPPVDVLLDCPDGTRLGDVRSALFPDEDHSPSGPCSVRVGAVELYDDNPVGTPPLLDGVEVTLAPAGDRRPDHGSAAAAGLVELHVVGGPAAGRRYRLARGEHLVGRGPGCGVDLPDLGVSRAHARVVVGDEGTTIAELDPTNPTLLDGVRLPPAGSALVAGTRLTLASTTLELRRPTSRPARVTVGGGRWLVHRPPRFPHVHQPENITLPAEPAAAQRLRMPLLASVAPVVLSALLAWVMRSPAMLLFALLSPVMLLGQWWSDRRHGRRSHRRRLAEYRLAVAEAEREFAGAVDEETAARREAQPDLATALAVAEQRDARLWQRRAGDVDDLVLRLGSADQPAHTTLEQAGGSARPAPPTHSATCPDVPVVVELTSTPVVGLAGGRARTLSLASSLIGQVAVWHSPQRVRAVLLSTSPEAEHDWAWMTRLPHLRGDASSVNVGLTDGTTSLATRVGELNDLVDRATGPSDALGRDDSATPPTVVVVLDGASRLRTVTGVERLLRLGPAAGLRFVCLDESAERLPAETVCRVDVHPGPGATATVTRPGVGPVTLVPDLPDVGWRESLAAAMASLDDATPSDRVGSLPASVPFDRLAAEAGVDVLSPTGLAASWSSSRSPRALMGLTGDGPWWLDLATDGPHLLVGGTTGAGKSELLQTLVAGLACASPPTDVSLVLVDYKGGSAFGECAGLPHVLGLVTDLDAALTERALVSLEAELRRRERVLSTSGAKDLDDHRRRRAADPSLPPLARLVLVVDEFKVLADELPDFVAGLVRLAAVGRSLGVHLVLATQRPGGIVSADMRANVSLRVALRVRDRSDSDDVIESPEAAAISDRMPGRAFVRDAGGRLTEVQVAHVGAGVTARSATTSAVAATPDRMRAEVHVRRLSFSELGLPRPPTRGASTRGGTTVLAEVVRSAQAAVVRLGLTPPDPPWLPPLPVTLPLSVAEAEGPDTAAVESRSQPGAVNWGLRDEPEHQRQEPMTWHPDDGHVGIAGGARTGRTTALRSLVCTVAEQYSPAELHVHVLQGRAGGLDDLLGLPHVGAVIAADADPASARRLVAHVSELCRRPGTEGDPLTVLVVDGWEAVDESLAGADHGESSDLLLRAARDGLGAGIRLFVGGGRAVASGRLASVLQRTVVMAMPDPLDLTLAGVDARRAGEASVPGRGFELPGMHLVQIGHVGATPHTLDQTVATTALAARLTGRHVSVPRSRRAARFRPVPTAVSLRDLAECAHLDDAGSCGVAVGLGPDDVGAVRLDTSGGRVVVSGPPRSGRSTALATLAAGHRRRGRHVVAVLPRRSGLSRLETQSLTTIAVDDVEALVATHRDHRDVGVLVDDAELLAGTPMEDALVQLSEIVGGTGGFVAAAVDAGRATGLFRGLVPTLCRDGVGLVLAPTSAADGDLLRVRLDPVAVRRPGLAVLVDGGVTVPVQVADALADRTDMVDLQTT
ncbi:FtsK/SpoIIIE domain-containing protein [Terracoccus luteus]|uniref:S-DNA-T family DNA segregation ATPase FtsK/SpoIIIE n=1 Tax=Terracoccus luteus TaxID=53356 RepID=A0A839Q047_9MICO|nr:FtsK/SpoIIIE domain-containing protein [Terracoccus luteus]MBB2986001.1 S-DNA-T family DNA segregation ATPase FtsK/SpoIIIE [Terracoccus luteus]MCP2171653.1 S-DNA-T family DNA segregation ATPase FtsK/SpoIIIE [Terracoccus luteus]